MSGRVVWVAVAATLLLIVVAPGHADPVDPAFPAERIAGEGSAAHTARVDQARQQVLDEAYQAELPRYRSGSGDGTAGAPGRRAGGRLGRDRGAMVDVRDRGAPGGVSSLISVVMWGMVIVVVVLGGFWLASELSKYGGDAELPLESEAHRMQAARDAIIDRPLGDADELARRGEFAEAIHTLLLRTLQELVRSAAVRVAPATTSREVLARVPLLADARSALAGLITAVEITHFGDEPANAADYERCRQQFHVFAAAFRGAGQAVRQAVAA